MASTHRRLIEPQSVFKGTATNHIAYKVADYRVARDFYMDVLGMKCTYDDGVRCAVSFGSPKREIYIVEGKPGEETPFVDHLAYSIADFDLEGAKRRLEEFGYEPEYDGDFAWTIKDPDGYKIQICAEEGVFPGAALPGATTEGNIPTGDAYERPGLFTATAVNHIAFRSPDYARSRDYYVDLLGGWVAFEDGQKCSVEFGPAPHDALYILGTKQPGDPANVDHFAISVADFDLDGAKRILEEAGFEPEDDGAAAWTIWDPDGYKIQICAETGVYPGARHDLHH